MKKIAKQNSLWTNIFCYIYIAIFILSYVLYLIGVEWKITANFWEDNFLFFTKQTGWLALIWIFLILFKKKKLLSYIGIIVVSNFFYVNIIKIILFNSFIGWNGEIIWLIIDIINHLILFFIVIIIYVLIILPSNIKIYTIDVKYKKIAIYNWIPSIVFFIGAILVNFLKVWRDNKWQYMTIYDFLTNYNPSNGGNLLMLLLIPCFICLIYLFSYILTIIFNLKNNNNIESLFREKNLNVLETYSFKYQNLIFTANIIFFLLYGINTSIQTITNVQLFNILQSIIFISSIFLIFYIILIYFFIKKHHMHYFIKTLLIFSIIYGLIYVSGQLLEIILHGKITQLLAQTCIVYGFFILFFLSFSYYFISIHYKNLFIINSKK